MMDPNSLSLTDVLSKPIMVVLCSLSRARGLSVANEMLEEVCRRPLGEVFSLLRETHERHYVFSGHGQVGIPCLGLLQPC